MVRASEKKRKREAFTMGGQERVREKSGVKPM